MAFALALSSVEDLPGGHGKVMFTTTTAIVVLTVRLLLCNLTSYPDFLDFYHETVTGRLRNGAVHQLAAIVVRKTTLWKRFFLSTPVDVEFNLLFDFSMGSATFALRQIVPLVDDFCDQADIVADFQCIHKNLFLPRCIEITT